MDADEDFGGTVLTMNRPKMGIRELLATPTVQQTAPHIIPDERETEWQPEPPPATAQPEPTDPLPRPGDDYKAHARPTNKPQATLFFVGADGLPDGFAYADLRRCRLVASVEPGKGPALVLQFIETEVRLDGRNLQSLCYLIGLHLMPWVWEKPGRSDRHGETATVITKIAVGEVAGEGR